MSSLAQCYSLFAIIQHTRSIKKIITSAAVDYKSEKSAMGDRLLCQTFFEIIIYAMISFTEIT